MKGRTTNNMPPAGTVRVAPVASIPLVLEQLGFEPAATLAEMKFDIQLFDNSDNVIPYAARTRLLQQCAEKTGCRHFGHLMGRNTGPSSYGIAGFIMQQSPDVITALRSFVRYAHLHVSGAAVYLEEGPESAFLGYSILESGIEATEQIADAAITAAFNILRALCGTAWRPTIVCFVHPKPENIRPFKQYFNAPLLFNAEQNGVAFSSTWLQAPLTGADPDLRVLLQTQINLLEIRHSDDFAEQVRRVLHSAVLMHQATAAHVSDLFSIHQRTMNRRLRDCGTCFRVLLSESRAEVTRQLLRDSSKSLSEIASTLDYADASTFARAFRRQSGKTPSAWREQYRQRNI
ncbi:MAG: AraC family transcriptional regulator [Halioglobus sp.]